MIDSSKAQNDTAVWAEAFLRSLLDSWLSASATPNGLFHPNLDRQWRTIDGANPTLVSQCRLIYNFSRGYQTFRDPHYAAAATQGLHALLRFFRKTDGGFCWTVALDGTPSDLTRDSYGHAFVVLALAAAAEALGDGVLAAQGLAAWRYAAETFTDSHGGLVSQVCRANRERQDRSQNPTMHTFEALMALCRVDQTGEALAAAHRVWQFVQPLADFSQGRLIEAYTADWTPLPPDRGGVINIGHQFEWAFLLSEWHHLTGDPNALVLGQQFLETGINWGLDVDGGVWEACAPDGRLVAPRKILWTQCEAIRAKCRYAQQHNLAVEKTPMLTTLDFYRHCFVDLEYGGLFAEAADDGQARRDHKGDIWKLDYHSVNMCLELMQRKH